MQTRSRLSAWSFDLSESRGYGDGLLDPFQTRSRERFDFHVPRRAQELPGPTRWAERNMRPQKVTFACCSEQHDQQQTSGDCEYDALERVAREYGFELWCIE